jgi:hypothetical protein
MGINAVSSNFDSMLIILHAKQLCQVQAPAEIVAWINNRSVGNLYGQLRSPAPTECFWRKILLFNQTACRPFLVRPQGFG